MENFTGLYGIFYNCPVGDRCEDCPIKEIENMSFKDKLKWFEKQNNKMKKEIYKHHFECSKIRCN